MKFVLIHKKNIFWEFTFPRFKAFHENFYYENLELYSIKSIIELYDNLGHLCFYNTGLHLGGQRCPLWQIFAPLNFKKIEVSDTPATTVILNESMGTV